MTTLAGSVGQSGNADGTGAAARFSSPLAVAVDGSGNVFVAEGNRIRKVTAGGVVSTLGTSEAGPVTTDIAVDAGGSVYAANYQRIVKVTPSGMLTIFIDSAALDGGVANYPSLLGAGIDGLAVDGAGIVYVAQRRGAIALGDPNQGWIRRFNGQGAEVPYAVPPASAPGVVGIEYPTDIAADSAGNVYVACGGYVQQQFPVGSVKVCSSIKKVSPSGTLSVVAGTDALGSNDGAGSSATFRRPKGIAIGPQGHVVVADTENHTIRVIAP